jgi:hypothetical protein
MKKTIVTFILTFTSYSLYADTSDSLENFAALGAAPVVCGFKVNQEMASVSATALFSNPSDLNPGGKYWAELQNDLKRIKKLTATESGKRSFCNRISSELSAFFD